MALSLTNMDTPDEIKIRADAWIKMQLNDASDDSAAGRLKQDDDERDEFDEGYELYNLAFEKPGTALAVMQDIIKRYKSEELREVEANEAKSVLGMLGAGPLEDLLSYHGDTFIGVVEAEAKRSTKFRWVLGKVAQNAMSDELWHRVQIASAKH